MVEIRKYEKKDRKEIIELVSKVLLEIFGSKPENIEDLKDIKKEYLEEEGVFYVAIDYNKVIGAIGLKKKKVKVAELGRLYVSKEYRRRRIGQALLNKALKFCRDNGYDKVVLSTYPQMEAAIKFYKENGFKQFKRDKKIFFEKEV